MIDGSHRMSITRRLMLMLAMVCLAVFSAVGMLLHWTLERELIRAEQNDLDRRAEIVQHFIVESPPEDGLSALRHHLDDTQQADHRLRVWVLDASGNVVYGGPKVPRLETSDGNVTVVLPTGIRMAGRMYRIHVGPALPSGNLIVALDTRERERLTRNYAIAVAVVCALGVVLTIALCAWTTRRALWPLKRLSHEAAAISPRVPSARLSEGNIDEELVELVRCFNQALARVESAYQRQEAFNADVAHELRTPLTTLISGTELALSRARSTSDLEDTLACNLEVLRQLSAMVNDMLFLSRSEHDSAPLLDALTSVDLRDESLRVAEYFEATLDERGQQLVIEGDASVTANAALVRRAIVNLVGNASRYARPGSTITITLMAHADVVSLRVCNFGTPISSHALPRIFDRFFRDDPARARSADNHGLGLAIVRAISRMHGGDADASTTDESTDVGFTLSRQAA